MEDKAAALHSRWGGHSHCSLNKGCPLKLCRAFQVVSAVKNPPAKAGDARDLGSISGLGMSPGEGNGNPLQYFCMGSPVDRGTWWATVHGVAKSWL